MQFFGAQVQHPDCHQYPATVFHEIKETLATVPPQLSAKYLQISHQSCCISFPLWCISFPLQVMISVQHRILRGNAANKRRPPFFSFVLLESVNSLCWCVGFDADVERNVAYLDVKVDVDVDLDVEWGRLWTSDLSFYVDDGGGDLEADVIVGSLWHGPSNIVWKSITNTSKVPTDAHGNPVGYGYGEPYCPNPVSPFAEKGRNWHALIM